MPKYVLGYHGGSGMAESEEDMAKVMEAWGAWFSQLGESLVDGGNPIAQATTISSDGSTATGGGANPLTGYSLVQASDMEAAIKMASNCPILDSGGSVEVGEAIEM